MTRPAVTSKRVAHIAGTILAVNVNRNQDTFCMFGKARTLHKFRWSDIRAVAGSALTQTVDKASKLRDTAVRLRAPATAKKAGTKPKRGKWTARKIAMRKK